jgi:DNA-binding response OmpR family regulator
MPNVTSILIVEDDPMTAELYQRLLEDAGYNILTAHDTHTATQVLTGIEVELILLDYELPGEDGLSWVKRLRQDDRYVNVPVVLVSHVTRNVDLSGDPYIWFMEKPRLPQHIVTAVESTIKLFNP